MLLRAFMIGAAMLAAGLAFAQAYRPPLPTYGTITTGGTAQLLYGGVGPANGFEVCNPSATLDLWVSDMTTAAPNAAGSYRVAANGGCYLTPRVGQPNVFGPVSLYGSTTGQPYTTRRW